MGDHVAVYLAELTTEMVTEMKSEIRSMVNAVDEIISPSMGDKSYSSSVESVRPSRKNRLTAKTSGEWEDSDESQSQNESSCSNSKTDGKLANFKEPPPLHVRVVLNFRCDRTQIWPSKRK